MHPTFHPPHRILMGPGPSDVSPRILEAMARPTIGHMDPEFITFMDSLKDLLRKTFLTKNEMTFAVSAPGSAGMEMCFANLVEPGDKVVVCINGVFGKRMYENVIRYGGDAVILETEWGRAIDVDKVKETLAANPDTKCLAFVHAETSTGARSDAHEIAKVAREHDVLTIVDTVTSLGGSELRVDDWGLDAVYSGSQKCLSAPPGLSPVTFNEKALKKVRERKTPVGSWFLDLTLLMNYWNGDGGRAYHHTAPINSLYALHEALVVLHEEGLEESWNRHRANHYDLKNGLEALGIKFLVPENESLFQLNAVCVPEGVNPGIVTKKLLEEYNLEIGAGLGPLKDKIWRIGLMGASSTKRHVFYCLKSLEEVLKG